MSRRTAPAVPDITPEDLAAAIDILAIAASSLGLQETRAALEQAARSCGAERPYTGTRDPGLVLRH